MKRVLLFALLFGIVAEAVGQAPPPIPALPDTQRLTQYSISGTTCSCSVGFAIYADASGTTDVDNWIQVWINGVQYLSTDATHGWALSSATGSLGSIARPITDAVLTFNSTQTGTVQILGARRPRRTSQFAENRGVPARDLNQAVTDLVAQNREQWDLNNRAILGQPGEVLQALPSAATRAGSLLAFNGSGQPIVTTPGVGTGNVVGPNSSTNNDLACWNGTTGGLLKDCGFPIGTSGATVPLLNGANTWSGIQTHTADVYFGSGRPWVDARSTANGTCAAALGNGSNNDQPALQCQVNYLNSTFSGGVLYVPPGNYHVTSTLAVPNGVHIVCAGWTSTLIGSTTDITVLSFGASGAITAGVHNCTISGYQNSAATQNMITIGAGSLVDFNDDYLSGGNWAVQNAGGDGHWLNVQVFGWGSSGGGIISTGANWYDHVKIDQGAVSTLAAFEQTTSSGTQENHFLNSDFSCSCTDSVIINDGVGTAAYTFFVNSVFSSPVVVTNGVVTTIISGELGANVTANAGTVVVSSSFGVAAVTVSGSASHIICGLNQSITCPTSFSPTGGSNTQVQYNNSGVLGGISGVTSNGANLTIASGDLVLSGASSGSSILNAPSTGGGTATLFAGSDTIAGRTVSNGGTGASSLTSNGVLYGNGTSAIQATTQGGANTVLTANSGAPSFSAAPIIGTSLSVGSSNNVSNTTMLVGANVTSVPGNLSGVSATLQLVAADSSSANIALNSFGNTPQMFGLRAGGTAASPTAIVATNTLFNFGAYGYDGANYDAGGAIQFISTDTFTAAHNGTIIKFFASPVNGTVALAMALQSGLQVGAAPTGGDEGAGTVNAAGAYYQNGTIGVTCSGSPTASFASKLGIVTHC